MLALNRAEARHPDEFAAQLRPGHGPVILGCAGQFEAQSLQIDLSHIWTQHVEEVLPRAWRVEMGGHRCGMAFSEALVRGRTWRGEDIPAEHALVLMPDSNGWDQIGGHTRWSSMSFSVEFVTDASVAVRGHEISGHSNEVISRNSCQAAYAKQLLSELREVATGTSTWTRSPNAIESLQQHLLEAFLRCFDAAEPAEDSVAKRRHSNIVRRFQQLIEHHAGEPLYIVQACKRLGVTERTLRTCLQEHVGVSPKRFLFLRRMSLTRQALRRAEAKTTTVTEIATSYGFWELGRFSVQYKQIFGESPSVTLRLPVN